MSTMNRKALSMAVVAVAMLADEAAAQRGTIPPRSAAAVDQKQVRADDGRTGFNLGVYTLGAMGLSVDGEFATMKTSFGPGAGVSVGYGFNRTFSAYASIDVAKQNADLEGASGSFGLRHLQLGARANLPYGSEKNVPYVSLSYGRRTLGARVSEEWEDEVVEADVKLNGNVFGIGGGIQHVMSPSLTIDGGAEIGFGRFSRAELDGISGPIDTNGSTGIRLKIGMTWRPAGRRTT